MSTINTSVAPYYDDYDPSKRFVKILANPGRSEQAREFTQVQTLFFDFLQRLSDSILKNGGILEGCSIVINDTTVTITAGKIYLAGLIRNVDATTITISGTGDEWIGAKIAQEIVTANIDDSLIDPAAGYDNYGQPGCDRLKETVQIVVNDMTAAPLYRLNNGELYTVEEKPELKGILDLLAKRTYDESGNYVVSGLKLVEVDQTNADNGKINIGLKQGKAYIKGYDVTKPNLSVFSVDMSTAIRTVLSEPKTYLTGTTDYLLNNSPVKRITQVVGIVQKMQNMTRGQTLNGIDYLPFAPVVSVSSVSQGATTYSAGVDYQLTDDGIDWSLSGSEPSAGTTYSVTWKYNKTMVLSTDYSLYSSGSNYYLRFLSGDKPVNNTQININYEFYLGRTDLICLNKSGDVVVVAGQPNIERLATVPTFNSEDMLKLGAVYCYPNSTSVSITNNAVTRLDMSQIQALLSRIQDLEYNVAADSLDNEAKSGEDPTALKGIFTDSFTTFNKCDLTHPDFDCCIDPTDGFVSVSYGQSYKNLIGNTQDESWLGSDSSTNFYSPRFTEVTAINQATASKSMLINPYAVFRGACVMSINPSSDVWIDENEIDITNTQKTTVHTNNLWNWWWIGGDKWTHMVHMKTIHGTATYTDTSSSVAETSEAYMRPIVIDISGSNFTSGSDNLVCKFAGQAVSLTTTEEFRGTQSGTAKANSQGLVKASFTVPEGISCGTVNVELSNYDDSADVEFTSQGTDRTTTVTNTIYKIRVVRRIQDPLAQSFGFEEDRVVTSIGLYFKSKDSTNPMLVQIRDMVDGYPGTTVYAEKVLSPSQVTTSTDGSLETKVTFDDPVFATADNQYCIVTITKSQTDSLFISELGGTDIISGLPILKQPYEVGVLFSSSNGLTWTANQTQDLKFKVYAASFDAYGCIPYNSFDDMDSDRVLLACDYYTPQGTSCSWEIQVDSGNWVPITVYTNTELAALKNNVAIRSKLYTSNPNVAPMIKKDSALLIGFKDKLSGAYVSNNLVTEQGFTTIVQYAEIYAPAGSSATIKYAIDGNGDSWITATPNGDPVDLGDGYHAYNFLSTVSSHENFRSKVELSSNDNSVRAKARKLMNILR